MLTTVLYADFVEINKTVFSSFKEERGSWGTQRVHTSLQFRDIRILIRTWSQHTLCVEWLSGKNLKPSVLVRMCYDRQKEPGSSACAHL